MGLCDLPAELVEHIARLLDRTDILSIRLACRTLYRRSTAAFATAFFSTVKIDLCPESLERLNRIASDDLFRRHVRHVRICELFSPEQCSNPPGHAPGTGHHWVRDPSTYSLDPSPVANPVIGHLHAMFARLVNLQFLSINPDIVTVPEPNPPKSTGLCVLDMVHVALLAVANIPLKSFHLNRGTLMRGWINSLVPSNIVESLTPPWSTHLIDLQLAWHPVFNRTPRTRCPLVDIVLCGKSLRRLSVICPPSEFFIRVLAARDSDRPPLEVLHLRFVETSPGHVQALVLRFAETLEHLCVDRATVPAGAEDGVNWKAVLADWAANLGKLQSFAISWLSNTQAVQNDRVLFDRVLEWDEGGELPSGGKMQFIPRSISTREPGRGWGVIGLRYSNPGRGADVRRVFAKAVEASYTEPADAARWQGRPEGEHLIAGRIPAKVVRIFECPELVL
ncbi:hypothetical protein N656DRAFT_783155 [Canariomyces notabilis]|uniref:F-box domain-containing protein n=1 Tax=Canariomyces notabilis TaxID=2074819 RepID=A0AAN6T9X5_9PEZI|nr:hypothetical protein N656DRAFT_783155 [Canariomyces arenarius]